MRTISLAIIFGICFFTQALPLSAQDKIEVRPDHHVGQATLPCTILNFTHSNVKVKLLPSGKMKTYPSSQIDLPVILSALAGIVWFEEYAL